MTISLKVPTSAESVCSRRPRYKLTNILNKSTYHGQLLTVDQVPLNELVVIRKGADGWTGRILSLDGQTAEFHFEQTGQKQLISLTEFDVLRLEF